jgi:hypothetical protein
MKYNEIDMKNWKESDINTDSLKRLNQERYFAVVISDIYGNGKKYYE